MVTHWLRYPLARAGRLREFAQTGLIRGQSAEWVGDRAPPGRFHRLPGGDGSITVPRYPTSPFRSGG